MRILHTVESYDPASHGMQQVVKQLSERLVKRGHDVTIATSFDTARKGECINGVEIVQFKISGKSATGYYASEKEIHRYRDFLKNSDFEVVTNFAAQQWATDIALPMLREIKGIKVFVPTGFSGLYDKTFSAYFESMKSWMKEYHMNVFLSNDYRDINFARNVGVDRILVIPNGAAADEFVPELNFNIRKQLGIPTDQFLILHVGSHTGLKGHKETIRIFKKAKIDNVTLLIIGNRNQPARPIKYFFTQLAKYLLSPFSTWLRQTSFPDCRISCALNSLFFRLSFAKLFHNKRLIVTSMPRTHTIAAYHAADVFLFPSNIECSPLVLFECMASRTPFLTTDAGNSREIITWSNSGILLPTTRMPDGMVKANIEGSAAILEDFFHDDVSREKMKSEGHIAWQKRFTWEKITVQYESLYFSLLATMKANAGAAI